MDQTIKSPVQIFINGKFFCIANEVEIKQNSPEFKKSLLPDNVNIDPTQFTGVIVNIKKQIANQKERQERAKAKKDSKYDEFYHSMVNAVDDPNAHLPIV
jgi:heat shock protein HspQ